MMEIELRYKIQNVQEARKKLAEYGINEVNKSHIIDMWFAPLDVQSHEEQKQWFDENRGIAYRIRQVEQADSSFLVKVESKQLTHEGNHDTFHEEVIATNGYDETIHFLGDKGYWNWLTIDKTRYSFDSGDAEIEIVVDEIDGLAEKIGIGAVLEIEYTGEASREDALRKLGEFAAKLGIDSGQRFEKSLTVEAMTVLAKF